jgi:phosphoribosylformylglycinamidine (FGAM) synthase-like enzyme
LKGNGLCHGITGNGYMMHCLYRMFKKLIKEYEEEDKQKMDIDVVENPQQNSTFLPTETKLYENELEFLKKQAGKWRVRAYMFGFATGSKSI